MRRMRLPTVQVCYAIKSYRNNSTRAIVVVKVNDFLITLNRVLNPENL